MPVVHQEYLRLLTEGAGQLGVYLSAAAISRLTIYLEELLRWSPKIDLVSQIDRGEIIRKHFLDSLAIVPLLTERSHLLDLGSGAGFPGLPIAIVLPHLQVSLLETRRKRVNFLKEVTRKLKATNIIVYEGRAEIFAQHQDFLNNFSAVITRATWDVSTFLLLSCPFLQAEGIAIAMKGRHAEQELHALANASLSPHFVLQHRHRYMLPGMGEQREALVFLKAENVSRAT